MNNPREPAVAAALDNLLHVEERAFTAANAEELGFTIVNETSAVAPFRQAALFRVQATGGLKLTQASGLVTITEDTPYAVWLTRLAASLPQEPHLQTLDLAAAADQFTDGWQEWLPEFLLVVHLRTAEGERMGVVLYARDEPWQVHETALLQRLHRSYAYCLHALTRSANPWPARLAALRQKKWIKRIALGIGVAILIPVKLSALAPAEVVALTATAVAAPQDGVVGTFYVRPSAQVKTGDKLFSLDDRGIESRREVAERALAIARADLLVAQQRAFDDQKSKGELAAAQGRVKEKEAELELVEGTLERVLVRAPGDGIVVFSDPNDWIGRPVQTGERIMQLADPRDAGVLVWLPVADAINLEPGAAIRLFLHTQPLSPLSASLLETSYQPVMSPAGVSSYRVRGQLEENDARARIGLRGTARVSGSWTILGYYVFRRPIAAFREWTGL